MNSQSFYEGQKQKKDASFSNQKTSLDLTLTFDQYIMIQNALPKKYTLIQYKSTNKRINTGSAAKFVQQDVQNFSKLSANYDNTEEMQGRSKRPRPKKIDRFLQNDVPQKSLKRITSERTTMNLDDQLMQCYNILVQLKKHKNAYPFLKPVDPKLDGAYNYLDIIKEPMDLSTVQNNLKNGQYQTAGQFHGDINKIWLNSYAYNEKSSVFYKLTIQIEKYYKHLCNNQGLSKKSKIQEKTRQKDKGSKRQYQKNSQSQFKGEDNLSNLQKANQNEFIQDSDQFAD